MIEVVSIKFKNRGKCYYFSPRGLDVKTGAKVIVETSKGLEIADCIRGNHSVMDTAVVQPLRPVLRIATKDDLRIAQLNVQREKEAFEICQKKIAEHGLDMKLVDVECNFEGTKTLFFFTSDGRVDFRELVKDLAGIFRNRIELRQIGVRDEAKMIGGIGICGRPYCCHQFLDEFQPVSTKMAKVQSLSLNPTKISGSCGRLMCCLRYEQEAYEDLIKKVPKQGAFVETIDGYGTAAQVNLLRQTVKVKLDADKDDTLHLYKANELAAVPGGRPRDGEEPPHVLNYVPEETEAAEAPEDVWAIPVVPEPVPETVPVQEPQEENRRSRRRRGGRGKGKGESAAPVREESPAKPAGEKKQKQPKPARKKTESPEPEQKPQEEHKKSFGRRHSHVKAVKAEDKAAKPPAPREEKPPKAEKAPKGEGEPAREGHRGGNRRRRPRGKGKPDGEGKGTAE